MELRSGKGRHDNTTGTTNRLELDTGQIQGEDMKSKTDNEDGKESKGNDSLEDTKTKEKKRREKVTHKTTSTTMHTTPSWMTAMTQKNDSGTRIR